MNDHQLNCSCKLTKSVLGQEGDQLDNDCDTLVDEEICGNDLGKSVLTTQSCIRGVPKSSKKHARLLALLRKPNIFITRAGIMFHLME